MCAVEKGTVFLRRYLSENSFRFHELNLYKFSAWIESQLRRKEKDPAFIQRCKVRDLRKTNRTALQALSQEIKISREKFENSQHFARLTAIPLEINGAQQAIEGLKKAVENSQGEKKNSCFEKLKGFENKLEELQREEKKLLSATPAKKELDTHEAALERFIKKIELDKAEALLQELQTKQSRRATSSGSNFEEDSLNIVREHVIPRVTMNMKQENLDRLKILSSVKLGCARAEVDYMVVILPGGEEKSATVLAIVEVKNNPNDIIKGFNLRQENIAWWKQNKKGYDPETYRTKVFRSGHFDKVAFHEEDGMKIPFTKESFRRFRTEDPGYYLQRLFFITKARRLNGMHTVEYARIIHRLASDIDFDAENSSYLESLYKWAAEIVSPIQTYDILKMYMGQKNRAQQILFT